MFTLTNRTRCPVHTQLVLDAKAEEHLLVLAKASFSIEAGQLVSAEGELVLADRPRLVTFSSPTCPEVPPARSASVTSAARRR